MTLARWETTTAIKALLWCSVLSKARLVRFLSKETRWVALDLDIIFSRLD